MRKRYNIGDIFQTEDVPQSHIIGIDEYSLYSHTGIYKNWISYTLESSDSNLYKRWWLSDEKSGLYIWTGLQELPKDHGTLILEESGICSLVAFGDSAIGTPYSSVLFYQKSETFYCSEVFDGSTDVLYMLGKKIIV